MFQSLWDRLVKYLDTPICSTSDLYEFLNETQGRLTCEEALEIALPTAIENGWVYENEKTKVGCRKVRLAKVNKSNKTIWMFDFALLEHNGEKMDEQMKGIGSIDVDDETGEVLNVFFMK